MLEIRCLGTQGVEDRQIIVASEAVGGYQCAHPGATKYVVDFLWPVEVHDRSDDGPKKRGHVSGTDSSGPKCAGHVLSLFENLAECSLEGPDRRADFHSLGGLIHYG